MKHDAVIFDLGNTLVRYYTRDDWPGVLQRAIAECGDYIHGLGRQFDEAELPDRVTIERGEQENHRVMPLINRLRRIFQFERGELSSAEENELTRIFLQDTFELAELYAESIPVLQSLRDAGCKTAILSNSPWGSPPQLWRQELARHGLADLVDAAAFCTEVGYRKPAPQAFEHILAKLNMSAEQCLFVGDDPLWDVVGPHAAGMRAAWINRDGQPLDGQAKPDLVITTLTELL